MVMHFPSSLGTSKYHFSKYSLTSPCQSMLTINILASDNQSFTPHGDSSWVILETNDLVRNVPFLVHKQP